MIRARAALAALLLCASAAARAAGPGDDPAVGALVGKARAACASGRESSLDKPVAADRAIAYESVDRLLNEGRPEDLPAARALAGSFEKAFGDRCLVERVQVFQRMTPHEKERRRLALIRKQEAKDAFAATRFDAAEAGYQEVLKVVRSEGDLREEARCLAALGTIQALKGETRRALAQMDEARLLALRAGDRNMLSVIDLNRAYALDDLGLLEDALKAQEVSLAIARETHDHDVESAVLINRASILLRLGRIEEGRAANLEAAEAGARTGDLHLESTAWYNLGVIAEKADDSQAQERAWTKALALARRNDAKPQMADAQLGLLSLAMRQARWTDARRWLDEARATLAGSDDPQRLADLDYNEALLLTARDRYAEALVPLDAAARRLEGLDAVGSLSRIDASRSVILYYMGDYEGAVREMRRAIAHAKAGGHPDSEADHHAGLGYLLLTLGETSGGMAEIETAERQNAELGESARQAYALDLLGYARYSFGDLQGGRAALEAALPLVPADGDMQTRAEILKDLALVEIGSGPSRAAAGRERLRESRELFGRAGDALGILHANLIEAEAALAGRDNSGAEAALARAAAVADRSGTREYTWLLHHVEGQVAEAGNRSDKAARAYRRAIAEVEIRRARVRDPAWRAAALEDRIAPYRSLSRLLRNQGRIDEAWSVARAGKARTFVESVQLPRLAPSGDAIDDIQPAPGSPAIAGGGRPSMDATSLRALLREGEALVDLYLEGSEVTAFVLRKDRLSARSLPLGEDAAGLLRAARWPGRPGRSDAAVTEAWRAAMTRLGSRILSPLEPDLEGVQALFIVSGGDLHGLPYGALEFHDHALMTRFDVSLLPAAEALLSRNRSGAGRGILAIGDPRAPGGRPLPAAAEEARAIAALQDGGAAFVGTTATEAAFKRRAPGADWIHVAAHGRVDPLLPGRSHLLLAPGEGEDGRLEAAEIVTLPLTASMVVLSACGSGVEGGLARPEAPGDDRAGLPRAFLAAGAGTVVVNLWEMDDAAGRVLIPALYARLSHGSVAAALAGLQRDAAAGKVKDLSGRSLAHPYYWAGLTIFGAGFGLAPEGPIVAAASAP